MRQQPFLTLFLSSLLTWSSSFPTSTVHLPPIRATIYSGVPGPSHCRGHVVLLLDLPPTPLTPADTLITTAPKCYNIPPSSSSSSSSSTGIGGCGVFSASKSSGCEARVFAEPNCASYLNTVVFLSEEDKRAVGGQWRSLEVRCGVRPPDEEEMGTPPLVGMMGMGMGIGGMKMKENKKTGRRWVG